MDGDEEAAAVSHADSRAVRFVFDSEQRLIEWGAGIRRALTQVAATQLRDCLTSLARKAEGSTDRIDGHSQRNRVSLAAQWMLGPEQGRTSLGSEMTDIRYGAKRRRIMQTIAGMFPCQAFCINGVDPRHRSACFAEGRRKL